MHAAWQFLTDFGDTAVTVPLAVLTVGFLLAAGQSRLALGWAAAILGCAAAVGALKIALDACGQPLGGDGLASPSGHSAMSTAVYGGVAAVIGAGLPRPVRAAVAAGTAALILGIALSRTVLRYHTPLEVVVGLAVGAAALGGITALVRRLRPKPLPVLWLAAGALALALLLHGARWPAERAVHRLAWWLDFVRPWCG